MSPYDPGDAVGEETFFLLSDGRSEIRGLIEYSTALGPVLPVYEYNAENTEKLFKLAAETYGLPTGAAKDEASRQALSEAVNRLISESDDFLDELRDHGIRESSCSERIL